MASWSEFAADAPRLAAAIRSIMQQYGPGLAYLATVRPDGGPRVHPVSPVITDEGLFCFVIDSPKRRDLERDGRYALHSFPPENSDDEAYLAGRAHRVTDQARIDRLAANLRAAPNVDWRLFEFDIEMAMLARHGRTGATPLADAESRSSVQVWIDPRVGGPPSGPRGSGRRGGTWPAPGSWPVGGSWRAGGGRPRGEGPGTGEGGPGSGEGGPGSGRGDGSPHGHGFTGGSGGPASGDEDTRADAGPAVGTGASVHVSSLTALGRHSMR